MIVNEKIIETLSEGPQLTRQEVKDICEYLSIDTECVMNDLNSFDRSVSILLALYFSDIVDKDNNLSMRERQVDYIYDLIDVVSENNYELVSTIDLIKLYKCNIIDLRDVIYNRVKESLENKFMKLAAVYNVKINENNKEDFLSMLKEHYLVALERVSPGSDEEILGNIDEYVKNMILVELLKYGNINTYEITPRLVGLNENDLRRIVNEMDNMTPIDSSFSQEIEDCLSRLTCSERKFIILKYKLNLTYVELAKKYKTSVACVKAREESILSKLKKDDKLKKFIKKR